ncbi:MAG: imidazolonepropionase [Planctomycetes bacterium]|nr:imidazolonepropionase [Planctomycetota bacterium]
MVFGASELVTCAGPSEPRVGDAFGELGIVEDGAVAIRDGRVVAVGKTAEIRSAYRALETIDASGKLVAPGFVDAHTHPVFVGTRENEFAMRLAGADYVEIARSGGGIRSSVRQVRQATRERLVELLRARADEFLLSGTTTVEAKSGYGLSVEDEMKSLEAIREVAATHPLSLVPTFLGAHEFPDEYREDREGYVRLICEEMIPRVAGARLAEFCDVFCEDHVFRVDESERILAAGKLHGLAPKVHADELAPTGGAELAGRVGAASADHLLFASEEGMRAMAEAGVVAVLLPGTAFHLNKRRFAPARRMMELGVPIALATDFNPGTSMTQSMPMILTLACLNLGLTPAQALIAATANAAHAISRGSVAGTIEVGRPADLVVFDAPNHRYLPYHYATNRVRTVVKGGRVVVRDGRRT